MREVILVGTFLPWETNPTGVEIWGCNAAFDHQKNLTRIYVMDDFHHFPEEFQNNLKAMPKTIQIVSKRALSGFPNSRAYDLDGACERFLPYFTSSLAYMMCDAIREGYEKITLHAILACPWSAEYFPQKSCLDFWAGVAIGQGIQVNLTGNSGIACPYPWQSNLYSYDYHDKEFAGSILLGHTIREIIMMPDKGHDAITTKEKWDDLVKEFPHKWNKIAKDIPEMMRRTGFPDVPDEIVKPMEVPEEQEAA